MAETMIVQKAILLGPNNKILLLRRSETDIRRPRQWDFPGGGLDDGEHLEQGVMREIKEETGISVDNVRPVFSKTEFQEWSDEAGSHTGNIIRIYYVSKAETTNVVLSHEHSEQCWVTLSEALQLLEYHRHKEVIAYIIDKNLNLEA